MKKYLFILATAAIVASCSNNDLRNDLLDEQIEIGFNTFTSKQTKAGEAENSSATLKYDLKDYQTSFKVWGYKEVGSTKTPYVFGESDYKGTVVTYTTKWGYSPARFWDKTATYSFFAAAPQGLEWVWDDTNETISLQDYAVDGASIATSTSVDPKAVMPNYKDIMISEDVKNYSYTSGTTVTLNFIHILSRLNIGVKKATSLNDFIVKLKSVQINGMYKQGDFDEHAASANNTTGNHSRWSDHKTNYNFGYTTTGDEFTEVVNDNYKYVSQTLIIPQEVAYASDIKLDGTNAAASSKPYLTIEYEIWTKNVCFTQEEIDNASSGDPAYGKTTSDVKTASYKTDAYNYTYNLADLFNGTSSNNIDFNEGWMNTLNITIDALTIDFDADVYQWAEKYDTDGVEVTVK